jgi:hypothetical protein
VNRVLQPGYSLKSTLVVGKNEIPDADLDQILAKTVLFVYFSSKPTKQTAPKEKVEQKKGTK